MRPGKKIIPIVIDPNTLYSDELKRHSVFHKYYRSIDDCTFFSNQKGKFKFIDVILITSDPDILSAMYESIVRSHIPRSHRIGFLDRNAQGMADSSRTDTVIRSNGITDLVDYMYLNDYEFYTRREFNSIRTNYPNINVTLILSGWDDYSDETVNKRCIQEIMDSFRKFDPTSHTYIIDKLNIVILLPTTLQLRCQIPGTIGPNNQVTVCRYSDPVAEYRRFLESSDIYSHRTLSFETFNYWYSVNCYQDTVRYQDYDQDIVAIMDTRNQIQTEPCTIIKDIIDKNTECIYLSNTDFVIGTKRVMLYYMLLYDNMGVYVPWKNVRKCKNMIFSDNLKYYQMDKCMYANHTIQLTEHLLHFSDVVLTDICTITSHKPRPLAFVLSSPESGSDESGSDESGSHESGFWTKVFIEALHRMGYDVAETADPRKCIDHLKNATQKCYLFALNYPIHKDHSGALSRYTDRVHSISINTPGFFRDNVRRYGESYRMMKQIYIFSDTLSECIGNAEKNKIIDTYPEVKFIPALHQEFQDPLSTPCRYSDDYEKNMDITVIIDLNQGMENFAHKILIALRDHDRIDSVTFSIYLLGPNNSEKSSTINNYFIQQYGDKYQGILDSLNRDDILDVIKKSKIVISDNDYIGLLSGCHKSVVVKMRHTVSDKSSDPNMTYISICENDINKSISLLVKRLQDDSYISIYKNIIHRAYAEAYNFTISGFLNRVCGSV